MSWNYRIVNQFSLKNKWNTYGVHEVYYNKDEIPDSMTKDSVSPGGESYEEFLSSWKSYNIAFEKEILYFDYDKNKFESNKNKIHLL
jgi:hypothetical protein